jgi:hypothetical protein
MAKKVGRPKKTLAELPEGWKDDVLNAGKQGYSDIEIRVGILDISNNLWGRLMEEEGEFWETITRARDYSQTWWLKHSRKELHNKEFNNKLYEMNMQNRYGWNKKTEVEHSGKIESSLTELTNEQLDALINASLGGKGKTD